jgi:hypothetical protein
VREECVFVCVYMLYYYVHKESARARAREREREEKSGVRPSPETLYPEWGETITRNPIPRVG